MVDSIKMHLLFDELSDDAYERCGFPFQIRQHTDECGQIRGRFYDKEKILSPLTGASCMVNALSSDANAPNRVAGYELEINVPACINGRNHELVNGVPRAAEAALELLRYFVLKRGGSSFGLEQLRLDRSQLASVMPTFLFEFASPEEAQEHLLEYRDHGEAVLNHQSRARDPKEKRRKAACFSVGPDNCFTVYIRLREFMIVAYIKQPNAPYAFATFPNEDVENELVERALRTVRVEVNVHGAWLKRNGLDCPNAWRDNPSAYETVFNLIRETLRLDEGLRVRAPTSAVIEKLRLDHQTVLRAHLAGEDIREHELVVGGSSSIGAQKRFSAFKRLILDVTSVDISIPWQIQSTKLSPHLAGWLQYPGEFVPSDSVVEHVFSRTSVPKAIADLKAKSDALLVGRPLQTATSDH